jgi:hypothetical protein
MEKQLAQEFHVTFVDPDSGRIRSESFEFRAEAERFASRQCIWEESWAVVDEVAVERARIAA